jgi:hypothetical protein
MLPLAGYAAEAEGCHVLLLVRVADPLLVIGFIVLAIGSFSSDRRGPDPTYLFSVVFVTLFIALFAMVGVVSSIVRIPWPEDEIPNVSVEHGLPGVGIGGAQVVPAVGTPILSPNPSPVFQRFDPDREHIREAVRAGLIAVAAGLVLLFHARRARELVQDPGFVEGPARRAYQVYLYAVCFIAILTTLVAGVVAAYGLFRIVAPGTSGSGPVSLERNGGGAQLVTTGMLALGAYAIFAFHWGRIPGRTPPPPKRSGLTERWERTR